MNLVINPPPLPNREHHPFVGTTVYKGLRVDLENLDGSTRTGVDANGHKWRTRFKGVVYGELRGSLGVDGDPLDVYIKNPPDDSNVAYIVHQNHPRNHPVARKAGEYDEDKVILGASSPEEAKELYLRHYDRRDYFRSMTTMSLSKFRKIAYKDAGEKIAELRPQNGWRNSMTTKVALDEAYELGVELALQKLAGALQTLGKQYNSAGYKRTPSYQMKKKLTTTFNRTPRTYAKPSRMAPGRTRGTMGYGK